MRGGFSSRFRWRRLSTNRNDGATETEQVPPTDVALVRFHDWMRRHQLGRKRVLDTMLAATYRAAGVTSLLTLNGEDFAVFGEFEFVPLVLMS